MGPLQGIKILEIGGIGPGPFCAMMLSDMGADIIRIDRKGQFKRVDPRCDIVNRNRRSMIVDLKSKDGVELVLKMVEKVDALQEGFRPGVMEGLGLGPEVCLQRNTRLVYGRITGWGQNGPLSGAAGHDINYIALSGALHAIGPAGHKPVVPLNLLGDYGAGGMLLAFGMVCALLEARQSGKGQVVDAAIVDGTAALMAVIYGLRASGLWTDERGGNLLDGGAHFYDTYETADGEFISIGAIEPQFYDLLLLRLDLKTPAFQDQMDRSSWPALKQELKDLFKTKTRAEWCVLLEGSDACFAPVLSTQEAAEHPHNTARKTFVQRDGILQHAPTPRFSRTRPEITRGPAVPGAHTDAVLTAYGFDPAEIENLKKKRVVLAVDEAAEKPVRS